ncbi:MAG TPA: dipeptidase [Candidatus Acidoferrum sp.]|nr:dipeptidase [Candidatus Acidoferrum sp.]
MLRWGQRVVAVSLVIALTAPVLAADDLEQRARAIHSRVFTIDTHDDIELNFATSASMPGDRADAQVSLDKMQSGGLGGGFFIVYVGQTERTPENYLKARADALAKFDAIHRMVQLYPERIGLATNASEAKKLHAAGKLVAFIGIENGFVIGKDLSVLKDFRKRGARYMTLVHNGHNDIGDSAQPRAEAGDKVPEEHGGLSKFGEQVVAELNRQGILVDVSHVSKNTMLQATKLSKAPVIASHSSVDGVYRHARNMDDEQLEALKQNGGVIQLVAFKTYLKAGDGATVSDFVDHIDYAVKKVGIDHVGISSDFGGGGGIIGWNNAGETFNVTLELVKRGYTEADIGKIWGGNVLRLLDQADAVAKQLSSGK